PPAAADDVAEVRRVHDVEPGGEDDRVQLDLPAVLRDDAVRDDLPDPLRYELDVGLHERPEEVAADDDPLAADPVAGGQLRADLCVRDLPLQVAEREALEPGQQPRAPDEAEDEELVVVVDGGPDRALQRREPAQQQLLEVAVRMV